MDCTKQLSVVWSSIFCVLLDAHLFTRGIQQSDRSRVSFVFIWHCHSFRQFHVDWQRFFLLCAPVDAVMIHNQHSNASRGRCFIKTFWLATFDLRMLFKSKLKVVQEPYPGWLRRENWYSKISPKKPYFSIYITCCFHAMGIILRSCLQQPNHIQSDINLQLFHFHFLVRTFHKTWIFNKTTVSFTSRHPVQNFRTRTSPYIVLT